MNTEGSGFSMGDATVTWTTPVGWLGTTTFWEGGKGGKIDCMWLATCTTGYSTNISTKKCQNKQYTRAIKFHIPFRWYVKFKCSIFLQG